MKSDSIERARERLREALQKTIEREQELGREAFFQLPPKVQNQLAVLQGQSAPDDDSLEAILASERILKRYNERLDNAHNLVAQLAGAAGRRAASRRQQGTRAVLALGIAAVAGAGATLYYRRALAAKAEDCRTAAACTLDGVCGATMRMSGASPLSVECVAVSPEDCRGSQGCREQGRCALVGGECIAQSDEDCRSTARCKEDGWCSAKNGRCVAATAQDCSPTRGCAERGACTPIEDVCKPGSDADCRQSAMCRDKGACTEVDHRCVKADFEGR